MFVRQGCQLAWGVTARTELLGLFFIHRLESFVLPIMRQIWCAFKGRVPKKKEEGYAHSDKDAVVEDAFLCTVHASRPFLAC